MVDNAYVQLLEAIHIKFDLVIELFILCEILTPCQEVKVGSKRMKRETKCMRIQAHYNLKKST
jgi:hypothetical protein